MLSLVLGSYYLSKTFEATSHKKILEPALDVLWRELFTLSPLLQCLSPDLWVLESGGKQSIRHELVSENFFCLKRLMDDTIIHIAFLQTSGGRGLDSI